MSFAKLEFLHDDVLQVDNIFQVAYFLDGKLMHKDFKFPKGVLNSRNIKKLPLLNLEGIVGL